MEIHFHLSPQMDKAKKFASSGRESKIAHGDVLAPEMPEQTQNAVLTTDLRGTITSCNVGRGCYGYSPEDLVGKSLEELLCADDQPMLANVVLPAVREHGRCEHQLMAQAKSGARFSLRLSLTLMCDADSIPTGMVGICTGEGETGEWGTSAAGRRTAEAGIPLAKRVIEGTEFLIASPVMHKFMGLVDRVAGHTETVLVVGETGTGKELVARTIHESSYRHKKALVDINCAALPEHLVESELFGYEKGAFSGADASKPGLFELADKSTIFLDEIGELQPQIQVKLLRVLDGAPYFRLGGHHKITVDVRVVAATNQDLDLAVKEGRFRKDLFHRLSQFQLRVPPLRERPEDIAALAQHFLSLKAAGKSFSAEALANLQAHSWPGNIRELRNLVAKLAMGAADEEISAREVMAELHGESPVVRGVGKVLPEGNLESMEEQMIIRALEQTGGHRAHAAEQLGISRRTLSRKLREYGIDSSAGDGAAPLGVISQEQQKFFRAKVSLPVTLRNGTGKELQVQAVNLSTGGMGLDAVSDPSGFAGLLDVSFLLPESGTVMQAKGRLVWVDAGGRAGLRFIVIEPALFQQLQHWTNQKMKNEGWETLS
ncbi:MAG: sigma 54-interacting transcriptional regulator [Terriglobales bacterium]